MGWRYFLYTMGGLMMLMFVLRFFVFHMYESPKYLMGRGRDEEAVEIVHKVARYNGRTSSLTLEMLKDVERTHGGSNGVDEKPALDTSAKAAVLRKLNMFSGVHVKSLFATRKLAYSTTLLIVLWGESPSCLHQLLQWRCSPSCLAFIGLAFPLYNGFLTFL